MSKFARLEEYDGRQVLCRVEAGENSDGAYGPMVYTTIDTGVCTMTASEGPWPEDNEGWDRAEEALANKDMQKTLDAMLEMARNMGVRDD